MIEIVLNRMKPFMKITCISLAAIHFFEFSNLFFFQAVIFGSIYSAQFKYEEISSIRQSLCNKPKFRIWRRLFQFNWYWSSIYWLVWPHLLISKEMKWLFVIFYHQFHVVPLLVLFGWICYEPTNCGIFLEFLLCPWIKWKLSFYDICFITD